MTTISPLGGRWRRIGMTAAAVLVVLVVGLVVRMLTISGLFTTITPGFAGTCAVVPGIGHVQGIADDPLDGVAFLASANPRDLNDSKDGIYLLRVDGSVMRAEGGPKSFHPIALSLFRGADKAVTLMALDRGVGGRVMIDILSVALKDGHARLTETALIESGALIDPVAIAALGPLQFYAVSAHGSRSSLGTRLEDALMLPRASVYYFDGAIFRPAGADLAHADGIALSADGAHVYVAERNARQVQVFSREPFSGKLTAQDPVPLTAAPEQLTLDTVGNLWIAGHPNLFALSSSEADPARPSPSEIFRLNAGETAARVVYAGTEIGGASIAAAFGARLLIGSRLDGKLLSCKPS